VLWLGFRGWGQRVVRIRASVCRLSVVGGHLFWLKVPNRSPAIVTPPHTLLFPHLPIHHVLSSHPPSPPPSPACRLRARLPPAAAAGGLQAPGVERPGDTGGPKLHAQAEGGWAGSLRPCWVLGFGVGCWGWGLGEEMEDWEGLAGIARGWVVWACRAFAQPFCAPMWLWKSAPIHSAC